VRRLHEGLAERHKHTAQLELGPGGKHERRLGERNEPTLGDGEVEYDEQNTSTSARDLRSSRAGSLDTARRLRTRTAAVAAGATAEEFSEVSTLAGNSAGDTAQIVCQKD
jgi:hypothetical protein